MVNYVGSFNNTDPSAGVFTCEDGVNSSNGQRWQGGTIPPGAYCTVGSFTYVNLNIQYQVNKDLLIQFTGNNIFNAKPPVDIASYAGTGLSNTSNQTGAPYNPSLHGTGTIGPFLSLGLQYNFDALNMLK
jgi:outer membrane receptor protein involved in Fe transport